MTLTKGEWVAVISLTAYAIVCITLLAVAFSQ